jgi:hypothetical protein
MQATSNEFRQRQGLLHAVRHEQEQFLARWERQSVHGRLRRRVNAARVLCQLYNPCERGPFRQKGGWLLRLAALSQLGVDGKGWGNFTYVKRHDPWYVYLYLPYNFSN